MLLQIALHRRAIFCFYGIIMGVGLFLFGSAVAVARPNKDGQKI